MWSLGIDIGGTFTDIVVRGPERAAARKVLTTHDDPARGVEEGVAELLAADRIDPRAVERVVHAATLFTNTLIERKGARTGLITTRGFRDVLEIGRERKYELYDLTIAKPPPLVPRDRRLEAAERMGANGEVLEPLDEAALDEAMYALAGLGVDAVANCFPGPAIIEERESTAVVGPGGWFEIDDESNLVMIQSASGASGASGVPGAPGRVDPAPECPRR